MIHIVDRAYHHTMTAKLGNGETSAKVPTEPSNSPTNVGPTGTPVHLSDPQGVPSNGVPGAIFSHEDNRAGKAGVICIDPKGTDEIKQWNTPAGLEESVPSAGRKTLLAPDSHKARRCPRCGELYCPDCEGATPYHYCPICIWEIARGG